jgi:sugar phosphate isomerase/epimerase
MKIAIIADEITQDVARALDLVVQWGLDAVELRTAWGKNLVDLESADVARLEGLVRSRGLLVSAIASPFLKCWLDGSGRPAPGDAFFSQDRTYQEHLILLDRAIDMAKRFGTPLVRCFAFWREPNPAAARSLILARFEAPVLRAERAGITLVLENESSTNVGTGTELGRLVSEIGSAYLRALWDPGNAVYAGEQPFPAGYQAVRQYLGHVHVKDVRRATATGALETAPPGQGQVGYANQLRALADDGYAGVLTLEPHYHPHGLTQEAAAEACVRALKSLLRDHAL